MNHAHSWKGLLDPIQRERHRQLAHRLQVVNAMLSQHLVRFFRLRENQKQLTRTCSDLLQIARQINWLIDQCDQTLSAVPVEYGPVKVLVGPECDECAEIPSRNRKHPVSDIPKRSKLMFTWWIETELLLDVTSGLADLMLEKRSVSNEQLQWTKCLQSVKRSLTRELLHIQKLPLPAGPNPVHELVTDHCIRCNKPMPQSESADCGS